MRRLVYLTSVREDLLQIFTYLAEQSGSLSFAQAFVARLRSQCRKLAALPGEIGRPRPEIRDDVRSFPYRGYVIFFRYAGERFEVLAILEGHRDVDAHFESRPSP